MRRFDIDVNVARERSGCKRRRRRGGAASLKGRTWPGDRARRKIVGAVPDLLSPNGDAASHWNTVDDHLVKLERQGLGRLTGAGGHEVDVEVREGTRRVPHLPDS